MNSFAPPVTRREQNFAVKRREKLRNDLISRFGISRIDNIDNALETADKLFSTGAAYFEVLSHLCNTLNSTAGDKVAHPLDRYNTVISNPPPPIQKKPPENVFTPKPNMEPDWNSMKHQKDELDLLSKNMAAAAEWEKKKVYREQLEEQQRLVTQRKMLEKQKAREEENEFLAMNSELVTAKRREQQMELMRKMKRENVDELFPTGKKKANFLADSNLFNKVGYELAQKEQLERDKQKVREELEKAMVKGSDTERSSQITSTLKEIYTERPLVGAAHFSVIDIPNHKTRRHYRSIAHLKDQNTLKYDPEPTRQFAGIPCRPRDYNPINGECVEKPSFTKNENPLLPSFMLHKSSTLYDKIRNEGHGSKVFNK